MKTPITYYGGKQKMVGQILPLIPKHNLYCEPFAGGAAIFFSKKKSNVEVLNDTSGHVVNFYKVIVTKFGELNKLIQSTPHSRAEHAEAAKILKDPKKYSEVKRAWAFWVQTNMSFASKIFGGYAYERKGSGTVKRIVNKKAEFQPALKERLDLVDMECNDAIKVIQSRDSKEAFFYVDPPYYNSDMGHYKGYTLEDFTSLLKCLKSIKGKFLLSSYPSKILNEFTRKGKWHTIKRHIAITAQTDKIKTEVLTANYDLKKGNKNIHESGKALNGNDNLDNTKWNLGSLLPMVDCNFKAGEIKRKLLNTVI